MSDDVTGLITEWQRYLVTGFIRRTALDLGLEALAEGDTDRALATLKAAVEQIERFER